ncbi:MAG: Arylsulfatase [Planctomycetes bacterium ADurb.Bin126]|nr:MAG: Arylsulfatase [Planctomycetes bacterium ADurb.Bin126]HOD81931.1 sulfatase-like hydrolase/transferase [Phycisphaerae bacterium]HQL74146.1 sulfatase-like hydrolase/transferase [Phycisphaerae bacterium]
MDRTMWTGGAVSRRGVLKGLGALLAAGTLPRWAIGRASAAAADGKKPNVLFLFSDDQRFDTVAALGNKAIRTPNLDKLVARGTAFTHHYIQGGVHGAICVSSRAILMTGQSLWHAMKGVNEDPLLGEVMGKAGYATFTTGKWHNGAATCQRAFQSGTAVFLGGMANHLKTPVQDLVDGKMVNKRTEPRYSSEQFADATVAFLKSRKGQDKPFFAYVSFTHPHDPRMAPKEYHDLYPPEKIEIPPNFLPEHPFDNGELKVRDEKLAGFPRTQDEVRRHISDYYACITYMDAQIGRILQTLEESGLAENTLIVFNGDNGLAVGRHGLMGKQNLYEHSARTPLIVVGPGVPAGKTCDALVYQHDLFPTVCAMAGVAIPSTVEGKSLKPLIDGSAASVHDSAFGAYRDVQRMVRVGDYKLIEYPKIKRTQLFNVASDPWEMKDLSGEASQADRIKDLRAKLLEWQKKLDDPMLNPDSGEKKQGKKKKGTK